MHIQQLNKVKSSHSHSKVDDESMTMTHEDDYDDDEPDVLATDQMSHGSSVKRQQSHKTYIKRQYSSNNNMHGEHGRCIPIAPQSHLSGGGSQYSSQYSLIICNTHHHQPCHINAE